MDKWDRLFAIEPKTALTEENLATAIKNRGYEYNEGRIYTTNEYGNKRPLSHQEVLQLTYECITEMFG